MIALPPGVRIYLACGSTDMRKGMVGLAMLVQQGLSDNPFSGAIYAFRGFCRKVGRPIRPVYVCRLRFPAASV